MKLENTFLVPAPPEKAWPLLLDVERIAPCLPGAELTEIVDAETFKGRAKVKVGPVALAFDGTARLCDVDHEARTARLEAKGADTKGRGGAEAEARFALVPEGEGTRVTVVTDLVMSGGVAQYGRASGLMQEIANQLVGQFAGNLAEELGRDTSAPEPSETTEGAAAAQPPRPPKKKDNSVSGISLLLASLGAMVRRWLGGGKGRR